MNDKKIKPCTLFATIKPLADVRIAKVSKKIGESNKLKKKLFEREIASLNAQKKAILDEIEKLKDITEDAFNDLKDFLQDIKMMEIIIDAESLLSVIEEKLAFLQAGDNTHVSDHIADSIERRIDIMGSTFEVNRLKNNFESYCINTPPCKELTTLQKNYLI